MVNELPIIYFKFDLYQWCNPDNFLIEGKFDEAIAKDYLKNLYLTKKIRSISEGKFRYDIDSIQDIELKGNSLKYKILSVKMEVLKFYTDSITYVDENNRIYTKNYNSNLDELYLLR